MENSRLSARQRRRLDKRDTAIIDSIKPFVLNMEVEFAKTISASELSDKSYQDIFDAFNEMYLQLAKKTNRRLSKKKISLDYFKKQYEPRENKL